MPLIQQIMGNNPEMKQQVLAKAKNLGAPDSVLSQIQNLK